MDACAAIEYETGSILESLGVDKEADCLDHEPDTFVLQVFHLFIFIKHLRVCISSIPDQETQSYVASIAIGSLTAGQLMERMDVYSMKTDWERGMNTVKSARQGHEAIYGTVQEKSEKRQEYRAAVAALLKKSPNEKRNAIYDKAAAEFGCSRRSIIRACKPVREPPR